MSLDKEEKKIHVTNINIRHSIFFLLLKLFLLDVIAAFMAIAFFMFLTLPSLPSEIKLQFISYSEIYFVLLVSIKIFLTIYVVLQWLNEYYEIRPASVAHRRGIIWRKEEIFPIKQIRAVGIHQGMLGRIFQYGTLTLYDWWMEKYATMYLIHNPIKYLHVLETLLPGASQEKDIVRERFIEEEEEEKDELEKELG